MTKKKKKKGPTQPAVAPEIWLQQVQSLPVEAQQQVARVVWWDHFAHRKATERWSHMDQWLASPEKEKLDPIDRDTFIKYLIQIGYNQEKATLRIR
jgi:hypothetical protein